jgi:hypothetical protein
MILGDIAEYWAITPPTTTKTHYVKTWVLDGKPESGRVPHCLGPITPDAPLRIRELVEQNAKYLKREFRYDSRPYESRAHRPDSVAFLWRTPAFRGDVPCVAYVGACEFSWRKWDDAPSNYELSWGWLHPYIRCPVHLANAWPFFRGIFGDFSVRPPLSPAMRKFLAKVEPDEARAHHEPRKFEVTWGTSDRI